MYKIILPIILTIFLVGCGEDNDSTPQTVLSEDNITQNIEIDDDTKEIIDKKEVPLMDKKYYGSWKYVHNGSELYITSSTYLDFTEIDENQLEVNDNGTIKYLIRNGKKSVALKGTVKTLSLSNQALSKSIARSPQIGGMNVILQNIKDKNIQVTLSTDNNGNFKDNSLPAGEYLISSEEKELGFKTKVTLDNDTNLGNFMLVNSDTNNFKTELLLNNDFIYANGQQYNAIARIHNISKVDGIGLNYTIALSDDKLKSFTFDNVVGTLQAGSYKDIPIHFSFNPFLLNEKEIKLTVTIKDINYNEWNDTLSFKAYRKKQRINFSSSQSSIRGYITLPNNKQKSINLSSGYIEVPTIIGDNYYIVLSNPDLSKETAYSIGYETTTASLTNFNDTGIYESQNSNSEGAIEIEKGTNISAYLHVGDIDFYKLKMSDSAILFSDILDATLDTNYISNEINITDTILQYGTLATVNNGTIFLNGVDVGQSVNIEEGDKLQLSLNSSNTFTKNTQSILTIGVFTSSFKTTTFSEDNTIDSFSFTDVTDAYPSTTYTSNEISIKGINTEITISTSAGIIIKNDIELSETTTTAVEGDIIKIKLDSSPSFDTLSSATVIIGSETKIYSITTRDKLFKNIEIAEKSTYYTSHILTIWENNTEVSIDNGILIKNGIELETRTVTANKDDNISIKLLSMENLGEIIVSNVSLGTIHDTWKIHTKSNNYNFIINNRDYGIEDTTYYYLTMSKTGNIDFTDNYGYSVVRIYDTDMNLQYTISSTQTKHIEAGSYIVKVYNEYSSDSMTIYSPILDNQHNFSQITNRDYGIEDTTYYYLTMSKTGNIDFTDNYGYSVVRIYDTDMNLQYTISSTQTKYIEAGSYIVKVYNEYSSDSMTIYSPILDNQHNFSQITNRDYGIEDTTYYYLTMSKTGNIDFTDNYGYSVVRIYDTDMNLQYTISSTQTKHIEAGSYIVKVYNEYSSDSMTIYSPVLD